MTRTISTDFRQNAESTAAEDVPVFMVTISHPDMVDPIRINSDIVDYVYGGQTFVGMAFSLSLLSDDESPPRAKMSVHNVDPAIGEWVRSLSSAARLDFDLVAKSDFTDASPRVAIGTPSVEVTARHLFLRNISVDAMMVTADVGSYDVASELWPQIRSTADLTPALYR